MFAKQIDEREADIEMAELLSGEKQSHIFGESREEQALRWRNFKGMEARALHKHFVDRVFIFLINLNSNENSAFSRYLKHATFKINEPLALQFMEKTVLTVQFIIFQIHHLELSLKMILKI